MNTLKLATKIDIYGINRVNEISINLIEVIIPQLKEYINQKIVTKSDRPIFMSKVRLNFDRNPVNGKDGEHFNTTTAYINLSYGSNMWLNVKTCLNGGDYEAKPYSTHYCQYFDKSIYLGEIKDQILTRLENIEEIIENYKLNVKLDSDIINKQIKEYNELMEQAEKIKISLPNYLRK
jgi:hypothetical protein